MKRSKVLLSSLGVGKCFTLDVPPGGSEEAPSTKKGDKVTTTTPILKPADAWKVVEQGDEVAAESAAGEKKSFKGDTKVVEVQRQGWDKLKSR